MRMLNPEISRADGSRTNEKRQCLLKNNSIQHVRINKCEQHQQKSSAAILSAHYSILQIQQAIENVL
jgi:hypothetical protein